MLPKLTVKTASSDNAPSISKSFVALPPPAPVVIGNADAVPQSPLSTMATVDGGGAAVDAEAGASPPPPPPRRLPSPPAADRATTDRPQSRQPGWQVISSTLNPPRHRRPRPAAAARLGGHLDVDRGSAHGRPPLDESKSSADWLRLLEKLGDTQFGEVRYVLYIVPGKRTIWDESHVTSIRTCWSLYVYLFIYVHCYLIW